MAQQVQFDRRTHQLVPVFKSCHNLLFSLVTVLQRNRELSCQYHLTASSVLLVSFSGMCDCHVSKHVLPTVATKLRDSADTLRSMLALSSPSATFVALLSSTRTVFPS